MEKYILITAVVIMIIILALDFILSKDGYQFHSCKKRFHKKADIVYNSMQLVI